MCPTDKFDPHEWGCVYDEPRGAAKHVIFRRSAELARELCVARLRPGDLWLDLGSGTGRLTWVLRHAGARVVAMDHDAAMVRFAGEGVIARAEQLPVADATLDGVVAVSLIGCLPDARPLYRELHRVLRPGGCAVLTYTNRASLLLKLNYLAASPSGARFQLHEFTTTSQELASVGLRLREARFYNVVLHAGRWLFPPAALAIHAERFSPRWLARNFVVVVEK